MKFKLLTVLTLLIFLFTGCSHSDTPPESSTETSTPAETPAQTAPETTESTNDGLDLGPYIGTNINELVPKFPDLNKSENSSGYIGYSTPSDTVHFSSDNGDYNIDEISIEYDYDYNIYGLRCFMSEEEATNRMHQICEDVKEVPDEHYVHGIYIENIFKPEIYVSFHHGEVYFVSISLQDTPTATEPDYIFPDSNSRYLSESDLTNLSERQLSIARNEISARHGRKFKKDWLREYFSTKSWYTPTYDPDAFDAQAENYLSEVELANMNTILNYEKKMGYK